MAKQQSQPISITSEASDRRERELTTNYNNNTTTLTHPIPVLHLDIRPFDTLLV